MNLGEQLAHLVNEAIRADVKPQEIIFTLDMLKVELQLRLLNNAAQAQAQANQSVIVLPNANGRMPQ